MQNKREHDILYSHDILTEARREREICYCFNM